MRGLDYPSERYVRLYTRDTIPWAALGWEAQALYPQIYRKVDRAGVLDLGDELLADALAAIFPAWPADLLERAIERLLQKKWVSWNKDRNWLFIPYFKEAETAAMTSAQRSREHRARDAAEDNLQQAVPDGDDTSQNGTPGDAGGRAGTPRDSVPSRALPSLPVPSQPEEITSPELAADGDSRPTPFTEIIHGKICHSCPACGATPDQMCQTPNGKPRNHHKARLKLESVQGEQAPAGSTGPPGVSSKEVMPLEGPRAPDLHTDAEPPPAEPSDPAVEGRKKPNRAQEVRSLLRALENRGLKGVAELWAARLEQTNASKRPNTARQATQLRKVLKGLDDGKTLQDARKLIRMAGERGWSGIEWRYLNGDGKTTGGYKPRSRYHMGRGGKEDEKEPERNF